MHSYIKCSIPSIPHFIHIKNYAVCTFILTLTFVANPYWHCIVFSFTLEVSTRHLDDCCITSLIYGNMTIISTYFSESQSLLVLTLYSEHAYLKIKEDIPSSSITCLDQDSFNDLVTTFTHENVLNSLVLP